MKIKKTKSHNRGTKISDVRNPQYPLNAVSKDKHEFIYSTWGLTDFDYISNSKRLANGQSRPSHGP